MLGLGFGLTGVAALRMGSFSPSQLFAASEPGIWLDPSDTSTLFTDTAGTTPVTAPGQTVALALDKSQGAGFDGTGFTGLGGEEVPAAAYSADLTGWNAYQAAIAWVDPGIEVTNDGNDFNQSASLEVTGLTVGAAYLLNVPLITGGAADEFFTLGVSFNNKNTGNVFPGDQVATVGDNRRVFVATATAHYLHLVISPGAGSAVFGQPSVREIPGYHATQSNSSFEPQYQTSGLLYDGLDDRLTTTYRPTTSGTIIARFNGDTASRVIAGSQAASDGRCFLALDASGRLGAGIGAQSTTTIFGGADIRTEDHVGAVTWDGTTVKLYLDGTEVYSAAQSGAVNTTVAMMHGALNANGTAAAFWDGSVSDVIVLNRVMTPTEITKTTNLWST